MQRRPRPGRRAPTTRDTFDDAWCPYELPLSCWTATTKAPRAHAAATEGPSHCAAHSATSQGSYLEKSTFGACAAPGVCNSKYGRGPLPITFAVSTWGKRRMYAL